MKNHPFISGFLVIATFTNLAAQEINAQNPVLDTIYANDHKNVALFFPEPIRQGITGSENFVFTYNRETQQHLGLLQATPGKESNLLIIGNSGSIFSYIIRYSEQLEKLNYFIPGSKSIGNEIPEISGETIETNQNPAGIGEIENRQAGTETYYQNFSSHLLKSKPRIGRIKKRNEGINLSLENIVFDREELYFVIEIKNASPIDYELNFLNLSVETRKNGRKKSIQKLVLEPVLKYNLPGIIPVGKIARFVYVLPKFSIAADKVVVIDLKELNGERDLKLRLRKRVVNNPE
jgi:hypothetical protein